VSVCSSMLQLTVCLFVCLSVCLPVCVPACYSWQSVCMSVCMSVCLSVCLYICLCVFQHATADNLFVCMSVYVCLYVCLCVFQHATADCLSICLCVCLYVCLCVFQHATADNLSVCSVDVGDAEPRTVVSMLTSHHSMDALCGRLAVLLCNVKPTAVKGVISHALLLTAVSRSRPFKYIPIIFWRFLIWARFSEKS